MKKSSSILLSDLKNSACWHLNKHLEESLDDTSKKKSKYNSQKIDFDGFTFDSKKEARRYVELRAKKVIGEITNLNLQVPFQLSVCKYIADFTYNDANGALIVEDVKSAATRKLSTYRLKNKLMKAELNIEIKEI